MKIIDFFYTQGETATELHVTTVTIWRWIKEGKFEIQRVGREVLIPKWEVELLKTATIARKRQGYRKL